MKNFEKEIKGEIKMEDQNVTLFSMDNPGATHGVVQRKDIKVIRRWNEMSPSEQFEIMKKAFRTFGICDYCDGKFYFED